MRDQNPMSRSRDTTLLSGWLFADLLLGLMVIFLVSAPGSPPLPTPTLRPTATPTSTATPTLPPTVTPSPIPSVTPSPTSTPTPTPTPTPQPNQSLNQEPTKFDFHTDVSGLLNGDPLELDRLRQEILGKMSGLNGQRAGIILTFGTAGDTVTATALSHTFNALMRDTLPGIIDNNTVLRDFIALNSAPDRQGEIEVEVYLFLK